MTAPLAVEVYLAGPKPIPSRLPAFDATGAPATWPACTATLISGNHDAVLVDTLTTTAEVHELSAWIRERGRQLRDVCVTHPHADHLYGLGQLLADFPSARGVTLASMVDAMAEQTSPAYQAVWSGFFPDQLPERLAVPAAAPGDRLTLEGHDIRLVAAGRTDTDPSSIVHVPDLDLVVAGDVAYDGIHMWMTGSTPRSRRQWAAALDTLEMLHPTTIIAGHRSPDAPDEYTLWLAAWDQLGDLS